MGTRGLYGIRKGGVDKATYNHFDSYPSQLGDHFTRFCAALGADGLSKLFDRIELVDQVEKPMSDQEAYCVERGWSNSDAPESWYDSLRLLQGDFDAYLAAAGATGPVYMTDDADFIRDSLFCEYAYIANLDEGVLEFWAGFQKRPDPANRYGQDADCGYYPCRLLATWPLDALSDVRAVVDKMEALSKADYKEQNVA